MTAPTLAHPILQFHVWSRHPVKPGRRYEGVTWASDPKAAGHAARRQFGNGKLFDVQGGKWGPILMKGA